METKRITRSRSERILGGVAGGMAAYFGIDPLIVRVIFAVLALFNGLGVILYVALWLIVPNEGSPANGRANVQEAVNEMQSAVEQIIDRVRSAFQR
jgi:phage shock protein C